MAASASTSPRATFSEPPQPPELERVIRVRPSQAVGMSLLAVFPLLALFGVFGLTIEESAAERSGLELTVRHPTKLRYEMLAPLEVRVRNASTEMFSTVEVTLDENYLSSFSQVSITPEPDGSSTVELTDLAPGEERVIIGEVNGNDYWRHHGTISASAGDAHVALDITTFVFP